MDALRSKGLYKTAAKHPVRPDRRRHKSHRPGKDASLTSKEREEGLERMRKRKSEKKQDAESNDDTDSDQSEDDTSEDSIPKKKLRLDADSVEMEEDDKSSSDLDGSPDVKDYARGEKSVESEGVS